MFLCVKLDVNDVSTRNYGLFPEYTDFNAECITVKNQTNVIGDHSLTIY